MTTAAQDRAPGATIEPPTEAELAALRILFADFRYFSVEAIERAGDRSIALRAWASTPTDEPAGFSLRVNGREVATAVLKLSGASERRHFAFWPDRPAYAINGVADLSRIPASDQGYKFECMNGDPPERFPRSQDYYVPPYWADCLDRWARPPADSVQRTTPRLARPAWAGQQDLHAHWFFFGYSNIWNIDDILVSTLGRSVRETGRVLDWGCGCGRVTQHLARIPGCQTFGADIDAANVLWARDNIPGAAFEVIGLDPPMPYADDFFDLIIGLSVFTHLSEASQFEWLRELRRVLKPGGILVASVAGHTALKKATLENALRFFRRTQARGFSDEMLGGEFRDMLRHRPTYYRNTRHLPEYVRAEWSRYFEIRCIERGGLSGGQDLVVCVKR